MTFEIIGYIAYANTDNKSANLLESDSRVAPKMRLQLF